MKGVVTDRVTDGQGFEKEVGHRDQKIGAYFGRLLKTQWVNNT